MVTLPKPAQPTPTPPPTPPKGLTMREMADYCGCSLTKVAVYVRTRQIKPSGVRNSRYHHNINEYDFTPTDETYFRTAHQAKADKSPQSEARRIASGWLTVAEIAQRWGCGFYKAVDLLSECHAPIRWEHDIPNFGRKYYKMPAEPPRSPVENKKVQRDRGDWVDGIKSRSVKDMVLDERKWRGMVGKRVAVEMKRSGVKFDAVLLRYSMCWFDVKRDNGSVETYMHNEAKVVEEAE